MNLKRILSVILAIILSFGACTVAFAEDQTTVPEGYIGIYTAEDLNNIRNNLSGKYILMNDIDLSVYENWEPIGTMEEPFIGELDGNGCLIRNLNIDIKTSSTYLAGLFAKTCEAVLCNIILINSKIHIEQIGDNSSTIIAGSILGEDFNSEFNNLIATGNITVSSFKNSYVGGIMGLGFYSSIENTSNYAEISVKLCSKSELTAVGGVIGKLEGLSSCAVNMGNITVSGENISDSAVVYLGGIEGDGGFNAAFLDSYNQGNISIDFSTSETYVGGLSGLSCITKRVYNTGEIILPDHFEGFAGAISGSINKDVFSIGELPHMEGVYYSNEGFIPGYSGTTHPYDMSIDDYTHDFGTPTLATSQEMKQQSVYSNFDFENVWKMEENGYPVLKNQPTVCVKESIELVEGDVYGDKVIANEWKTSNPNVATVNENGEIVAVSAGVATITVNHGYGYAEEITVTVAEKSANAKKNIFEKLVDFISSLFKRILTAIRYIFGFLWL